MLIYSQKRKKIADCAAISVERYVGGGKEGKYALAPFSRSQPADGGHGHGY